MAQRSYTPPSSLEESQTTSRRLGCVGLSIVAHICFLAALSVLPESLREVAPTGGGDFSVEAISPGAAEQSATQPVAQAPIEVIAAPKVESAPITDETSDVVAPVVIAKAKPVVAAKPKPIAKPAVAKAAKKSAPKAVVAPVMTEEAADAPPVIAQPDDEPSDETEKIEKPVVETATKQEDDVATPVAVVEPESQTVAPQPVAALPVVQAKPDEATPVAAVAESQEPPAAAKQSAAASEAIAGTSDQAALPAAQGPAAAGGAITGPIRDASELKALGGNPNPTYPARDRLARREGKAVVVGQVTADGRISKVVLEQSSGSREMDLASMQTFKSWRFQAGQAGWVRKPFQFRLIGEAQDVPARLGKTLRR